MTARVRRRPGGGRSRRRPAGRRGTPGSWSWWAASRSPRRWSSPRCWRSRGWPSPRARSPATWRSSARSRCGRRTAARRRTWCRRTAARCRCGRPRARRRPGCPGCSPSCSSRRRAAATWPCCGRRPAPPTSSPRRSTGPASPTCSGPSPATTPCWWSPGPRTVAGRSRTGCVTSPTAGARPARLADRRSDPGRGGPAGLAARSCRAGPGGGRAAGRGCRDRPGPGPVPTPTTRRGAPLARAGPSRPHPTARDRGAPVTERVVLAYSGGLDTSVAIGWIAERTGAEVVAVAADVGQGGEDLDVVRKRALACGAVESEVLDLRDEFAGRFCLPALRAGALYMDRYPLVSALSRPVIVEALVAAAARYGAGRGRARLHRQGQRPGPFRGRRRRAGAGPAGARAGPGRRHDPGQGDRLRRAARACRWTSPAARRTRSTRTCGAARWRPASSRTRGTRRSRSSTPTPPTRRCPGRRTRSWSASTAACRRPSTAARSASAGPSRSSTGGPARRASAGSTWSRTGSSASRAARCTRLPARSRCSPRTASWRT